MDLLIIGAGMAGLTAARRLRARGLRVGVLEKARGAGGRLATRRENDGPRRWDHGAQFLTIREPEFRRELGSLLDSGALRPWGEGGADARQVHRDGMSAVVKHWSAELLAAGALELGRRAVGVAINSAGGWQVALDDGGTRSARALLITAPLPQALELLAASGVDGTVGAPELGRLGYRACAALLLSFANDAPGLPAPGWRDAGLPEGIRGVFDQRAKGVSPGAGAWVIHADPGLSAELQSLSEVEARDRLLECVGALLPAEPSGVQLHRWRYSEPERTHSALWHEPAGIGAPLVLAGDAFGGPRIEGAWRSGNVAAERLWERLGGKPGSGS
jgi:renalase